MTRAVMQEAVDQEDFDRMDKGLPPKKKVPVVIPEAKPLMKKSVILYSDITEDFRKKIVGISAFMKNEKNEEGISFTGYEVTLKFEDKSSVTGWMANKDFIMLRHDLVYDGRVDVARILDI